jgi:hypothetical protein
MLRAAAADLGLSAMTHSPLLCVLAGAVGAPCIVFGSVVGWMNTVAQLCYVLLVDLCA